MADTIPQIGSKGDRLDILIRQGGTFGPKYCTILKSDGSPEDITGCTFIAEIRKTADATAVAASAVFAITNAAGGEFNFTFEASATKDIAADPVGETEPDSQYVWDLEMHYPGGRVRPLLYGDVAVFREVSKGTPV